MIMEFVSSKSWRWGIRIVWVTYGILLFTATHVPVPRPVAKITSEWDKVIHFGIYFVLTILTAAVFLRVASVKRSGPNGQGREGEMSPRGNRLKIHRPWWLMTALLIFAAFDEILQGPVGRHPDVADWLADAAGIGAGMASAQLVLWCHAFRRVDVPQPQEEPAPLRQESVPEAVLE